MKILILAAMYPNKFFKTSGIFIHEQAKEFVRQGHEVIIIAPYPWVPPLLKNVKEKWLNYSQIPYKDNIEGIKVYYPKMILFPKNIFFQYSGLFFYLAIKGLVRKIYKEFKFDIIHAHTVLPAGFAAVKLSQKYNKKNIITIHGADLRSTIHLNKTCNRIVKEVLIKCDCITLVSNKLKDALLLNFKDLNKSQVHVINNGIDLAKRNNIKCLQLEQQYKGKKILLSVGNLIPLKGHKYVIQVLPELISSFGNLMYLIIGSGPEDLKLKHLAKELNVDKYIEFIGALSNEDVFKYMSLCDCFILPSYNEGFGVVYIEAMSLGKPTIACKNQGIEDCITHNETGFLVQPHNTKELFYCIQNVLSEPDKANNIGNNAKKLIEKKFTWEANVEKYLILFKSM